MATIRLLLAADVHLDTPFMWAEPIVARARRRALRDAVRRIADLAAELRVDALCFAGDLYEHERAGPDTGEFLRTVFADVPCPVLLAPGNHDWYGPASLYRQVEWPRQVVVFRDDRLLPFSLADGFTVWGAAHRAPANTDGFLDGFRVDRQGVSVALFHGSERGGFARQESGKVPHAPFAAEQVAECGLAHALVGHFHAPALAAWHTYPGNPEPLAFGEYGERGAVLVDVGEDGAVSREVHAVAESPWQDLQVRVEGASHADQIREQVAAALAPMSGIVRLTVSGEAAPGTDVSRLDLTGLGGHLEALVVRPPQLSVGYDLAALAGEATVRGHFIRDVLASELPFEQQQRVLDAGLRALDGRLDELAVR
ncbi:MAG TPA: metallophosphoesterase [Frankiaceae bacterium]|jgi:DNA repair exonuclease SbcCD nuclease subunit|nr:metallophosphoesterase [Frankiaceae bacterium]